MGSLFVSEICGNLRVVGRNIYLTELGSSLSLGSGGLLKRHFLICDAAFGGRRDDGDLSSTLGVVFSGSNELRNLF